MKKNVIFILIIVMILTIVIVNKLDIVYAAEPEIRWIEKSYDDYYPYSF